MSPRSVLVLLALGVLAVGVPLALRAHQPGGPSRDALDAHLAGVEPEDAGYPRMATAMRSRAWLAAGPGQPEGVALFIDLPDVVFGPACVITPSDLRASLLLIRGLTWDAEQRAWIGGERRVALTEVRELLVAAAPSPSVADALIDLLAGTPAPGLPVFAALLAADPPTLQSISLTPFHGDCGRLMQDRGRPPYVPVERAYCGFMAAFSGAGWPAGWRVLQLRSLDP